MYQNYPFSQFGDFQKKENLITLHNPRFLKKNLTNILNLDTSTL